MTPSPLSRPARRVAGDPLLRARDERLEALKAVVGKLAHDFNNFLVPQFGYVTLLRDELPAGSNGAQYVTTMESAGRRTESYIESILLGMRPHRQFAPSEFSFGQLVNSALDQWSAETTAEIQLHRDIEPAPLFGDEKHWRNAVVQLLANARYALATGGKLEVLLRQQSLEGAEVERLGLDRENVYRLTIRDHGFGMPPAVAERAFEPFFTTRTQIKAPGLGLTIVHSVAQFHGGQVELHTVEEQGTTVTLWIPIGAVAPKDRLSTLAGSPKAQYSPKKRVLLVEEDPMANEVLRDWLARFDLDVQLAKSFEDAIRMFEKKQSEWALVITETDLREHRGEELFERLHPLNRAIPWIFLAGRRQPELPGEEAPLVMQKPVTLRAFAEVVQKHAAR